MECKYRRAALDYMYTISSANLGRPMPLHASVDEELLFGDWQPNVIRYLNTKQTGPWFNINMSSYQS